MTNDEMSFVPNRYSDYKKYLEEMDHTDKELEFSIEPIWNIIWRKTGGPFTQLELRTLIRG